MKKITKTLLTIIPSAVLLFPAIAAAQDVSNIDNFIDDIGDIVESLIPIVAAIALLAFFYGLAKYIFQADDEEAKDQGKRIMIGGIVALFLIAAIGGIIEFLGDILGVSTDGQGIDPSQIEDL